ncbi:MAG: hypothetical protein ACK56N_03145, partial [Betaproteobacteria bacterium]
MLFRCERQGVAPAAAQGKRAAARIVGLSPTKGATALLHCKLLLSVQATTLGRKTLRDAFQGGHTRGANNNKQTFYEGS